VFFSEEQKVKNETLSARKKSEQNICHVDSITTLGVPDDIITLLRNLGTMDYVELKCMSYD